jgi:hypothetical protein
MHEVHQRDVRALLAHEARREIEVVVVEEDGCLGLALELGQHGLVHSGEDAEQALVPVQLDELVEAVRGLQLLDARSRAVRIEAEQGRPDELAPVRHAVGLHIRTSAGRCTSAGPLRAKARFNAPPSSCGVVCSAGTP